MYAGNLHSVVEVSMLEASRLLSEVLAEIPKSQSTTTSITSMTPSTTQQYYTALEEQLTSEDKTTIDEQTPSVTETSDVGTLPSFKKEIEDTVFVIGEPAQLKCIVIGNPTPQVEWYVDGDLITSNK